MQDGPTPQATFQLEHDLEGVLREAGRVTLQCTFNAAEPAPAHELPSRVRLGRREFRRNRTTCNAIATRFGPVVLERCFYQAAEPGEPGLADEAARLNADLTQQQTCHALDGRHGVNWSHATLRRVVAAMAQHYAPLRHAAQADRLQELLEKAEKSRGKHRPTLSVGRDGVIIPMRPRWEEARTATLSVLDRAGRRLGTVYLGRMPQPGQGTMTAQLVGLIRDVLERWCGPTPRLVYVTDAGNHPQEFFRGTLFGRGVEASRWAAQLRRTLRDERGGVTRVVQRAQALRRHRGLEGSRTEFDKALGYLKKYASHMDYAGARRRGLPIGSGVTEAACKTIFGYRFKQSGMRWKREHGQHVLARRVILKSGVWDTCPARWLVATMPVETVTPAITPRKIHKFRGSRALPA